MTRDRVASSAYGAMGGATGAGCMTFIRNLARRGGLIETTVPQAIEEKLAELTHFEPQGGPILHHGADQVLHFGYGALLGAVFGLSPLATRPNAATSGVAWGLVTWLFGSALLVPALGAARPAHRRRPMEILIDLAAHITYGLATRVVHDELREQPRHGARRAIAGEPIA